MKRVLINIDVDNLERGVRFYREALLQFGGSGYDSSPADS
jgi:hypothetical protein